MELHMFIKCVSVESTLFTLSNMKGYQHYPNINSTIFVFILVKFALILVKMEPRIHLPLKSDAYTINLPMPYHPTDTSIFFFFCLVIVLYLKPRYLLLIRM